MKVIILLVQLPFRVPAFLLGFLLGMIANSFCAGCDSGWNVPKPEIET